MSREFMNNFRDKVVKHCKIIFPTLVVVIVALTVVVALNAIRAKAESEEMLAESSSASEILETPESLAAVAEPMAASEDAEVRALIETYITAEGIGDVATISSICDELPLTESIKIEEIAKYKNNNTLLEVYTKKGYKEGSFIAFAYYTSRFSKFDDIEVPGYQAFYIDRNAEGELYIKLNSDNITAEENEYIQAVIGQVDVIEFNNRVNVEYTEVGAANPELFEYIEALRGHVNEHVGEVYAAMYAADEPADEIVGPTVTTAITKETESDEPQYATVLETVNVRNSDSIQADRLGQIAAGERIQVQEVRVNGWTKILYEGKDGYVKSEYLKLEESVSGLEVIGTVTATDNVNIRAEANTSSQRIGGLANGSSLELFAEENGWCKVNFNGVVGYVNSDFVRVDFTSGS